MILSFAFEKGSLEEQNSISSQEAEKLFEEPNTPEEQFNYATTALTNFAKHVENYLVQLAKRSPRKVKIIQFCNQAIKKSVHFKNNLKVENLSSYIPQICRLFEETDIYLDGPYLFHSTENLSLLSWKNSSIHKLITFHERADQTFKRSQREFETNSSEVGDNFSLHDQLLVEFDSVDCPSKDVDLLLALFSKDNGIITEYFHLPIKNGKPLKNISCLYKNIGFDELHGGNIFLIAYVYKKEGVKEKSKFSDFRRPIASGYMALSHLYSDRTPFALQLFFLSEKQEETSFLFIPTEFLRNDSKLQKIGEFKGFFSVFRQSFLSLMEERPEILEKSSLTNLLNFPQDILFNDLRNDFYITLEQGHFNDKKNYEVVTEVLNGKYQVIANILSYGSGSSPLSQMRSIVWKKISNPIWTNDTFKAVIPEKEYTEGLHLKFEIRTVSSSKPPITIGFSFLNLLKSNGTLIEDQIYNLPIFKIEKGKKLENYLNSDYVLVPRKHESLSVKTKLTSTTATQQLPIMRLRAWRKAPNELVDTLQKITFLDQSELLKFFKEIFQALFEILDDIPSEKIETHPNGKLAFETVINLLQVLENASDKTLKRLLESYIKNTFKGINSHRHFLFYLSSGIKQVSEKVSSSLRLLGYIFQFVESSYLQAKKKDPEVEKIHQADIQNLLDNLIEMMKLSVSTVSVFQALTLSSLQFVVAYCSKTFSKEYAIKFVSEFLKSLSFQTEQEFTFYSWLISESGLFSLAYDELYSILMNRLHAHSNEKTFAKSGLTILALIDVCQKQNDNSKEKQSKDLNQLIPFISPLCSSIITQFQSEISSTFNRVQLGTSVLSLFYHLSHENLTSFFNDIKDQNEFNELITKICSCFLIFLEDLYKNPKWTMMLLFSRFVSIKVSIILSEVLEKKSSQYSYSNALMTSYFNFNFKILFTLNSSLLKSRNPPFFRILLPDERLILLKNFNTHWSKLGKQKAHFLEQIPSLFTCFSVDLQESEQIALQALISLFEEKYKEKHKMFPIQEQTIYTLDKLISQTKIENSLIFKNFFPNKLGPILKNNQSLWKDFGDSYIQKMNELVGILLDCQELPSTGAYHEELTALNLKIMEFYKGTARSESYIKYIYILSTQSEAHGHFLEAAVALEMHSKMLSWDRHEIVPRINRFEPEPESTRKRKVTESAIQLLDKGQWWEKAAKEVLVLKEQAYQNKDFQTYTKWLQIEASFYTKITETHRLFPEYFRVAFYGQGFPATMQSTEFIYAGTPLQKPSDFAKKIQQQFPKAIQLKQTEEPSKDIVEDQGQHFIVASVLPSSEAEIKNRIRFRRSTTILPNILDFQERVDVNVFISIRSAQEKENTSNIKVTKTFYKTDEVFPCLARRAIVIERLSLELDPIEHAIEDIEKKMEEIQVNGYLLSQKKTEDTKYNLSILSMTLKGVIDAAVNGGISKYGDSFLTKKEDTKNTDILQLKNRLKAAFRELITVIDKGLTTHYEHIGPNVRPMHQGLVELFEQMKTQFRKYNLD